MRVDVVGSILRVVFHNEDRSVIPVWTVRHRIDQASNCKIVIGDRRRRRRPADACSASVIIGKIQQDKLRQFFRGATCLHKLVKFPKKFVGTKLVRIVNREIWIERIEVITLCFFCRMNVFQLRNRPWPWTRPAARVANIRRQYASARWHARP